MEYKEEFAELNQAEETVDETAEIVEEIADTTEELAETPETETTEEIDEEPQVVENKKKKFPLQLPIIIAACIVIGALIGFLAFSLFAPTVEGSWVYASEEGYNFYYTFDEKKDSSECDMSIGSIHFPGTYEVTTSDTTDAITVNVYAGYVYGTYTYELQGNRLMRNRVLTLTAEDGSVITLTETKKPKDSDYIVPDENFVEVEELTGEWEFLYEEYDASLKLTINDDGTMIYDQFGYQELHCVYTATDSTINLSFFETELIAQEEEYYFNEAGELIFLGVNWTRVGAESTADQS